MPSDPNAFELDADLSASSSASAVMISRASPRACNSSIAELLEAELRYLARSLLDHPALLLREHAPHFGRTRPGGDGEPWGLSPRHFESPAPRPRRPPHVNGVQTPPAELPRPSDSIGIRCGSGSLEACSGRRARSEGRSGRARPRGRGGRDRCRSALPRSDTATTPEITLALPAQIVRPDPLRFKPGRTQEYEQAAAFGLSHVLFEKSPGGVMLAAQRTARFREMVDSAASGSGIDPDVVEAIVLLESAGREDMIAGDDPENAAGLTQILAETATSFLGMPVDLEASRRLTRLLDEAIGRGDEAEAARLRSERRGVDARFDPGQALAGPRYLTEAKKVFGRDDLAIVSYHMGIGNLAGVVRAYTGDDDAPIDSVVRDDDVDYARLYFDSSPILHRAAWERLASFGDDSQSYYWRVLGALGIMHLFPH